MKNANDGCVGSATRRKLGVRHLGLLAFIVSLLSPVVLQAQLTATNAVGLIEDNVVNARDTLVPLGIGAAVLFVALAAGMKFWKRTFK